MKFPTLKNNTTTYPKKALCPQCKKRKVLEPHSMAILSGGANLMDRKRCNGWPDDRMDGFLEITWHGAHDTGIGEDRDIYCTIDLAKDCRGGQYEMYFCSTACLRKYLNSWVDDLETKVHRKRHKTV